MQESVLSVNFYWVYRWVSPDFCEPDFTGVVVPTCTGISSTSISGSSLLCCLAMCTLIAVMVRTVLPAGVWYSMRGIQYDKELWMQTCRCCIYSTRISAHEESETGAPCMFREQSHRWTSLQKKTRWTRPCGSRDWSRNVCYCCFPCVNASVSSSDRYHTR